MSPLAYHGRPKKRERKKGINGRSVWSFVEFVGKLEKIGIFGNLENLVVCGGRKKNKEKGKSGEGDRPWPPRLWPGSCLEKREDRKRGKKRIDKRKEKGRKKEERRKRERKEGKGRKRKARGSRPG